MSTQARCGYCSKLLGTLDIPTNLTVYLRAPDVVPGSTVFVVKCPRCGKTNHIEFVTSK